MPRQEKSRWLSCPCAADLSTAASSGKNCALSSQTASLATNSRAKFTSSTPCPKPRPAKSFAANSASRCPHQAQTDQRQTDQLQKRQPFDILLTIPSRRQNRLVLSTSGRYRCSCPANAQPCACFGRCVAECFMGWPRGTNQVQRDFASHRRIVMNLSQLKTWACAASLVAAGALSAQAQGNHFTTPGNILISDQYNNRLIEVNPDNHRIVWSFGNGSSVAGPHSVVGVNDAQRIGAITLVAGTGVPAGAEPTCPNGCPDNRVILVDPAGNFFWQYGKAGVTGS